MFHHIGRKSALATLAIGSTALLGLTACSSGPTPDAAPTFDPDEEVTLTLAFWGNDSRAALYDEAIAAFNEEYPNITVNSTFLGFAEFWEKRQTEAAGGGLPDVMQFDYSYLRQYSENGLLLDLEPFFGNIIDTEPLPESVLASGVVGDETTAITTGTNAWSIFVNNTLLDGVGIDAFEGGSWEDYQDWMGEVTDAGEAAGQQLWGGTDYTIRIQNFEVQQRAKGEDLFTEDGEPNFSEDDLAEFWASGAPLRDGIAIPQQRTEEVYPISPIGSGLTASEPTWDNFGTAYLAELGADTQLELVAPPVTEEGAKDLYLKPAMMHSISAGTEHPEAAATLVNFLINSPEAGAIFGTNRGLPASETALEGAELDAVGQQILDYEETVADRIGDAPPAPIVGYGTLEQKFRDLGEELGFGTITVDEAVMQFFSEMDVVLNG